ncbi:hypothetical protein B0T16DRAFT_404347 [Cercophora newfieldiana]|uniref:Uncharacterized protein n=1 Tax=Cercophora newfieldiana TaxID=92897 RepID=A0AA40CU79_9PEZI|nr:hypothetical protein B0T16DRAFT_404347 [Cercophora newfieldiana]
MTGMGRWKGALFWRDWCCFRSFLGHSLSRKIPVYDYTCLGWDGRDARFGLFGLAGWDAGFILSF